MRFIFAAALALLASPAVACGTDTDCQIGDRTYRLHIPQSHDGAAPIGALFFAHGYRGSAANAMRNGALIKLAEDLGVALVALKSAGEDWNLAHRPRNPGQKEAAEYAYMQAVLDDLGTRLPLDDTKLVVTGFSAGGMMTWTLACGMSDKFTGFIPMSGTFWGPVPSTCTTPVTNIIHIHGTEDGVVPLGGRPIGETRQGDVPTALAMYRDYGDFQPSGTAEAVGNLSCSFSQNPAGKRLDFCTFPGGHSFSIARLRFGWDRVMGGA